MKKFYSFIAMLMCTLFSLSASAQTDSKAALFVKGELFYATLQNDANHRQEVSVNQNEAAAGAYKVLDFNAAENLFNIKAQNESKQFFVYKNGVQVANATLGESNMFEAQTNLKDGDVVKVFTQKPYTTKMGIGFQNGAADQVEVVMDKVSTVSAEGTYNVLEGTEFQIKATEGNEIEAVYYCNEDVVAVDGVYSVAADREGDALIIIKMKQAVPTGTASIKMTGRFFNIAAQNDEVADPREAELFQYPAQYGIDKTEQINIVGEMKVRLTVQAEDNAVYVAVNGQQVASAQDGMFQNVLTLKPGDEVVILNAAPSTGTATAKVKGFFYTISAQDVNTYDPRAAQVFSFDHEVDEVVTIPVNESKTLRIVGQAEKNAIYVAVNGQPVASTQKDMFDAEVTILAGDVIEITNAAPVTGTATAIVKGKFYTVSLQDVNANDPKVAEIYSEGGELNDTIAIALNVEKTVRIVGQSEGNKFYVTLNGKKVASKQNSMFEAEVTLKADDVLYIANAAEYTATVNLEGLFYTFSVQNTNVDGKAGELYSVTPGGEAASESKVIELPAAETEVRLIGQAPDNKFFVTLDGVKVASTNENNFEAVVTLKNGSVLNVVNEAANKATVNINGEFYTFSVQATNAAGKAGELYSVTPGGKAVSESKVVELTAAETEVRLIGQSLDNKFFVTLDGKKVASESEDHFEAVVTLKNGSVLNVANEAANKATVNIDGMFYTFSVQATDASGRGAELYSVTPGGEDLRESKTIELTAEEVEVRLIGQSKDNRFFVTLDGVKVSSTSEDNFDAIVTLKNGSVLNVTNEAANKATVNLNGNFYTFSVQATNADGRAAQLYSVTPAGQEVNETATIELTAEEVEVRLIGQSKDNKFFVTVDGVTVPSTSEDNFDAIVTLKNGSVINVVNEAANKATVNIDGTFYTFSVQNVKGSGRNAEMFNVTPAGQAVSESKVIELPSDETEVRLIGQSEGNKFFVTLDGVKVASESDDRFEAVVTLKNGSVLNVANEAANKATINIDGTFYTFSVQDTNADGRDAQLFNITPAGQAVNETATIELTADEVEVRLIGQAPDNKFFVTLDGKKLASTSENGFEAVVTLKNGSVLNVLNESANKATINIDGTFYTFSVQDTNADGRDAQLFNVTPAGQAVNETATIELTAEEVTVRLIGQAPDNAFYVTLNGVKVASTSQESFEAEITLKNGDVLNVLNAEPSTGIATVNINGTFWNVSAQDVNIDDPRTAQVFSYQPNGEITETVKVNINESKTIRLIVQNEDNAVYVALNGKQVESKQATMFEAEIVLHADDVLDILNADPNAIHSINADAIANGKVYTINGVAVKDVTRPGIYVVNGKKVMIKK